MLVICFAALCLSAAPAMADFVDLTAYETNMTVNDSMAATATIEALVPGGSLMDMYIKEDGGNVLQSLEDEPYNLFATLDFTGSGNDYTAIGSLELYDTTSVVNPKIAADFVSTSVTFTPLQYGPIWASVLEMFGNLTPQNPNTSILLGDPWVFVGTNGTISLAADPSSFTHGNMMILEFYVPYGSLQDFFEADNMDALGMLNAKIHSTPIPAAVLLGVIGLGVVGLKLRKYA